MSDKKDKNTTGGLTGSIRKPIHIPGKRMMITKNMILEAQKHTKSNKAAAKWMGVQYNTYKKYAKQFGVFEQHLNPSGKGIKTKGWGSIKINIEEILFGERELPPKRWNHRFIKQEIIKKGFWRDECHHCGYNEINLETDECCTTIDFLDGNSKNWKFDNIRLLCPNCFMSFNGWFYGSGRFCPKKDKRWKEKYD